MPRRFFVSARLRQAALAPLAALLMAGGGARAEMPVATPAAVGLIVGFKAGVIPGEPQSKDQGPWASGRVQAQAQWDRAARQGRERLARVALEAGVPMRAATSVGGAQRLGFERPLRGEALDNALRRTRLHPDVAWVEPDVLVPRLQAAPVVPDDAFFPEQWQLHAPDVTKAASLNLTGAWRQSTGGPVVVAVVDSGVRFEHPDLAGRLLPGYDMVSEVEVGNDGDGRDADASDPGDWLTFTESRSALFQSCAVANSSWHGTFIAGQIAAASNNAIGISGVNWAAQVLPVRVSGKCGALVSDLLDGLRWAAGLPVVGVPLNPTPARVINLSFGGDAPCSAAYQSAIDDATNAGALVVVAAGNRSTALARPADCQRVMAVASVRRDGAKTRYSSFGPQVALSTPGGSFEWGEAPAQTYLRSTDNTGFTTPVASSYGLKQGTSFAAPQAAGVASLMLAVNPALTPAQLIARMQAGARPHTGPLLPACSATETSACACTADTCGSGLLDAERALLLATGPAARIVPVGVVRPAATVVLDARQSAAIPGSSIVSYLWTQLDGPTVPGIAADQPLNTVSLPGGEASYRFRLTVTDSEGRSGQDDVTVLATDRPQTAGLDGDQGGGGASGWLWGSALWLWVACLWTARRRRPCSIA